MARNLSVQGALSGRLGNMIGYKMFGKNYLRSMPSHYTDRQSDSQLVQRSLFKTMVQTASGFTPVLRSSLHTTARPLGLTEGNYFLRLNKEHFVKTGDTVNVDYSHLRIAEGPLANVVFSSPVFEEGQTVRISFEKNTRNNPSANYDRVQVVAYAPALRKCFMAQQVERQQKRLSFVLPALFEGRQVELYGYAVAPDGTFSNSAYIGCRPAAGSPVTPGQVGNPAAKTPAPDGAHDTVSATQNLPSSAIAASSAATTVLSAQTPPPKGQKTPR